MISLFYKGSGSWTCFLMNCWLRERTDKIQKMTVQMMRGQRKWVTDRTEPVPAI